MDKIGSKVLIKRGLFVGSEGIVENKFQYKNVDTYTVAIFRGKNITDKFITTVSDSDFEVI